VTSAQTTESEPAPGASCSATNPPWESQVVTRLDLHRAPLVHTETVQGVDDCVRALAGDVQLDDVAGRDDGGAAGDREAADRLVVPDRVQHLVRELCGNRQPHVHHGAQSAGHAGMMTVCRWAW
jgi:hypothetical protein